MFDDYDDIVDKTCEAWNFFANDPSRIASINRTALGHGQSLEAVGMTPRKSAYVESRNIKPSKH